MGKCLTFVIEVHLRCSVAVVPGDMFNDVAQGKRRMRTVVVDVKPHR